MELCESGDGFQNFRHLVAENFIDLVFSDHQRRRQRNGVGRDADQKPKSWKAFSMAL
jgi:hypothetical protein